MDLIGARAGGASGGRRVAVTVERDMTGAQSEVVGQAGAVGELFPREDATDGGAKEDYSAIVSALCLCHVHDRGGAR